MHWSTLILALTTLLSPPSAADSVRACDPQVNRYCPEVARLAANSNVQRALESIAANDERARRDLIELTEIPAPPFGEAARAQRFLEMLRESGADTVWIDPAGNAIGLRRGTGDRTVVLEGHLDTVFPEDTDVTVQIRGDTLAAPGIGDDTRGLVVVLEVLRAIAEADIRTEADMLFIGTVGEEGLGDLSGVKYLFREGAPRIDSYIAVDGGDANRLAVTGIGSYRYRLTFSGPGGHSWGAFGTANPIHALGRAIAIFDDLADDFTRSGPRTSYNVGRVGGGTSVNSVAYEAWAEIDMRSEDDERLRGIDRLLHQAVEQALEEQNGVVRRGEPLVAEVAMIGNRPSGGVDPASPLPQRAQAVISHMGGVPELGSGSTNSNIPFSLGAQAVTIGRGGQGGDGHALTEWWLDEDGYLAIQQALLLLLLESGMEL